MRTTVNFIFLTIYLGLICYGAAEVIRGLIQPISITMQPFLAIGLIVAGLVGFVDVIRDFGHYGS